MVSARLKCSSSSTGREAPAVRPGSTGTAAVQGGRQALALGLAARAVMLCGKKLASCCTQGPSNFSFTHSSMRTADLQAELLLAVAAPLCLTLRGGGDGRGRRRTCQQDQEGPTKRAPLAWPWGSHQGCTGAQSCIASGGGVSCLCRTAAHAALESRLATCLSRFCLKRTRIRRRASTQPPARGIRAGRSVFAAAARGPVPSPRPSPPEPVPKP